MKKIKIGIADDNKEFCDILTDYFADKEDIDLIFVSHDGIKAVEIEKEITDSSDYKSASGTAAFGCTCYGSFGKRHLCLQTLPPCCDSERQKITAG